MEIKDNVIVLSGYDLDSWAVMGKSHQAARSLSARNGGIAIRGPDGRVLQEAGGGDRAFRCLQALAGDGPVVRCSTCGSSLIKYVRGGSYCTACGVHQ